MTFGKLRNSYIQAERGSTLFVQKSNNIISLKTGQFFIGAGDTPLHLQAPGLHMALPPKAIALVTVRRNKETRFVLMDSGNSSNIFANVAYQQRGIGLKSADELIVIPRPARTPVNASKSIARKAERVEDFQYTTRKGRANVGELLERNQLLNCRYFRLANAWPYQQLEHRYGSRLAGKQRFTGYVPKLSKERIVTIPEEVLKPIVYIQPNIPNAWMSAHAVVTEIKSGHYFLASGSILAHTKTPLIVDTPHGAIMLKKDSVVLISSQATMTRVFNLYDCQTSGVLAIAGKRSLKLVPGSEVALMERSEGDISRIVLDDSIGHKNMRIVKAGDGRGMITGEFSMGDLLAYHPLLQKLRKSTDKVDQDLIKSLMKTAAARSTMDFGE
jgi:hypothetical protein